ncbi:MAG: alkaline phosphatase family protein [Acidimicrobiales bacterium]|nr:alkaline phosphatase family protein [Acidimicrobiales bacterium]
MDDRPHIPDYRGACISNVVPALLYPGATAPAWVPEPAATARRHVLLLLDGLGWSFLQAHRDVAPVLAGLAGGPISTVVPSTTAAALTSLTTGVPPGEHGLVGYRVDLGGEILNALRWTVAGSDVRRRHPPDRVQPVPPFLGEPVPVVTRSEFADSGFTAAHLAGGTFTGVAATSGLLVEVPRCLAEGADLVYAYYDGLDRVGHVHGVGSHLVAELAACDALVAGLLAVLPDDVALVVTADHGMVHAPPGEDGSGVVVLPASLLEHVRYQSGEPRFRWLHTAPDRALEVLEAAAEVLGDRAWVVPVEQVLDERWLGPRVTTEAAARLGSVAVAARTPIAVADADDASTWVLVGRHGSLTADEMTVPLLAGTPVTAYRSPG